MEGENMSGKINWGGAEFTQIDPESLRETFDGHPLDNPKVLKIIEQHAPELLEAIKTCTRQKMSEHPDELEKWETEAIIQRQRKYTYETDYGYVLRILYEELFSVNQWPGEDVKPFQESFGMTAGGLISHFMSLDTINGLSMANPRFLPQIDSIPFEQWIDADNHVQQVAVATLFLHELSKDDYRMRGIHEHQLVGMMKKNKDSKRAQLFHSLTFRLLQILTNYKEFVVPITNVELRKIMQIQSDKVVVYLGECIQSIWKSCAFIVPNGHFVSETDDKNHHALKYLLFLRTHPELQILFRHYSASGLVNELNSEIHVSLDDILFTFGKNENRDKRGVTIAGAKFEQWLVNFVREDIRQLRSMGKSANAIAGELLKRYHPDTRPSKIEKDIVAEYTKVVNAMKKAGEFSK